MEDVHENITVIKQMPTRTSYLRERPSLSHL